jgi:hypothetical protein
MVEGHVEAEGMTGRNRLAEDERKAVEERERQQREAGNTARRV